MGDLTARIKEAQTNTLALNDLIAEYMPFIKKEVSDAASFGLEYEDRISIGMLVFMNCVRQYNADKGSFFGYVSVAIRNRMLDEARKQARRPLPALSLDAEPEEGPGVDADKTPALQVYSRHEERAELAEEIEQFVTRLSRFGVTLDDLEANCPRHKQARAQCTYLAHTIADTPELRESFLRTGRIPASRLAARTGVSLKTLDKYRRYIIALTLIFEGDYPGILALIPQQEAAK